jgi:sugar lactone lactonase YvrE
LSHTDARRPREVAYFVPEAPPGRSSIQFNDILVTADGLIYVTDRFTGGLYIVERT